MTNITVTALKEMKRVQEKIACLTAYDSSFAALLTDAAVDVILVGDSLGMVIQGHDSTTPVSVQEMVYHTQCVRRGSPNAFIIADMPFLSAASVELAIKNAGELMQQGGAQMVKVEGAGSMVQKVVAFKEQNIPVCGHLGLLPQSVHKLGGYKVQGKEEDSARQILDDAKALVEAGIDLLVLECVPESLAKTISETIPVPTIGIGAGRFCDGQVLVLYDLLGITPGKRPRFSKNFLAENASALEAIRAYVSDVKAGNFPQENHIFK